MKKYVNHTWDYASADTKYFTHGIHTYPAMMIPQVARRLIAEEGKNAERCLDPFCGSGSVLLEFKIVGKPSFGIDINPLAVLISEVKTTPIDPKKLEDEFINIKTEVGSATLGPTFREFEPTFFHIDYWFKKNVIKRLIKLKKGVDAIKDLETRNFFLVCFSETVRKSSNTRGSEFKLYRISEEKLKDYDPDPVKIFSKIVKRNIDGI